MVSGNNYHAYHNVRQRRFCYAQLYLSSILIFKFKQMIIEKINYWGVQNPGHIAHRSGGKALTYGELLQRSNAVAAFIREQLQDKEPKVPVAIRGHKESEMLIGFLGAVKSGHPYVPIDSSMPEERVEKIIQTSGATLVLDVEKISEITNSRFSEASAPSTSIGPDDPFYILFTSGSTGDPKGVVITRNNLESFVSWMVEEQKFSEQKEVFLNQAPFSFDLSVMDIYPCLVTGNTLVSITRDDVSNPAQLHKTLQAADLTVWVSTPSFAQLCLMEKTFQKKILPKLRKFLFCGETLTSKTAAILLERFDQSEIWNTYGPTEATVATSSIKITKEIIERYPFLPVGYPKPQCNIYIYDEHDQPLESEKLGQIIISGDNVSPGYLGRPDLTARSFFKIGDLPAYRTGDQGYLENNLLFFKGRMDNQIKLHGYRIELGDIESNLETLPGIRSAAVIMRQNNGTDDYLIAFIVDENSNQQTEFERTRTLKKSLAEKVPGYMVPKKFVFMSGHFPMTTNGKIDRKKLMASVK